MAGELVKLPSVALRTGCSSEGTSCTVGTVCSESALAVVTVGPIIDFKIAYSNAYVVGLDARTVYETSNKKYYARYAWVPVPTFGVYNRDNKYAAVIASPIGSYGRQKIIAALDPNGYVGDADAYIRFCNATSNTPQRLHNTVPIYDAVAVLYGVTTPQYLLLKRGATFFMADNYALPDEDGSVVFSAGSPDVYTVSFDEPWRVYAVADGRVYAPVPVLPPCKGDERCPTSGCDDVTIDLNSWTPA